MAEGVKKVFADFRSEVGVPALFGRRRTLLSRKPRPKSAHRSLRPVSAAEVGSMMREDRPERAALLNPS